MAFASTLVSERLLLHSTDGRIELLLDGGAVEGPTQVLAQEIDRLPGAVDGELLSGPYRLARWPDEPLRRPGVVTFEVPVAEEAAVRDRLDRIALLRRDGRGWQRLPTTVSVAASPRRPRRSSSASTRWRSSSETMSQGSRRSGEV